MGKNIFIKRDDKTGFVYSGNKIRKLSYLLQDALEQKSDVVITCGGLQSNHARATAYAARELGLDSVLLLRTRSFPDDCKGNYLLDKLVGAEIRGISYEDWPQNLTFMEKIAEELRSDGKNPYIIPEGGSNHIGTLGYVKCFEEIEKQGQIFSDIFSATGSGGTTAGLLLGQSLLQGRVNPPTKIHTLNVCNDEQFFQKRISKINQDFKEAFDLPSLETQRPSIFDGHVGPGYAKSTPDRLKRIVEFCQQSGILLDPVYTGKAFFGMLDEIQKNPQNFGDDILFIHTGGGFGNFSFEDQYLKIL